MTSILLEVPSFSIFPLTLNFTVVHSSFVGKKKKLSLGDWFWEVLGGLEGSLVGSTPLHAHRPEVSADFCFGRDDFFQSEDSTIAYSTRSGDAVVLNTGGARGDTSTQNVRNRPREYQKWIRSVRFTPRGFEKKELG